MNITSGGLKVPLTGEMNLPDLGSATEQNGPLPMNRYWKLRVVAMTWRREVSVVDIARELTTRSIFELLSTLRLCEKRITSKSIHLQWCTYTPLLGLDPGSRGLGWKVSSIWICPSSRYVVRKKIPVDVPICANALFISPVWI